MCKMLQMCSNTCVVNEILTQNIINNFIFGVLVEAELSLKSPLRPIWICLYCTVCLPVIIISPLRIKAHTFLLCGRSSALFFFIFLFILQNWALIKSGKMENQPSQHITRLSALQKTERRPSFLPKYAKCHWPSDKLVLDLYSCDEELWRSWELNRNPTVITDRINTWHTCIYLPPDIIYLIIF